MDKVFKSLKLKSATLDDRTIAGSASAMGVLDRYGDVMMPGCFAGAIEGFKKSGFIPVGHNWMEYDKVVAMPAICEERGRDLYTEAKFHSTSFAEDVRTICKERIESGLEVGLSIGFSVAESEYFSNGSEFMAWAKGKGYAMNLIDDSIASCEEEVRAIHQVKELFEYSIVTVPANPKATVFDCKDFYQGARLVDRLESVCAAADEALRELTNLKELRTADGRGLSPARMAQAKQLATSLLAVAETTEVSPNDQTQMKIEAMNARIRSLQLAGLSLHI